MSSLNPIIATIENDKWISNCYENSYNQESNVDFLLVIIPSENEGALETLLMEAISENEEDKETVERSISYVDEIHPIASKYLSKNRLKLKACLGVTCAIQYPEKLFSFIDGYFIAFAAQKNYFTFHTDDMMDACKEIVDHHKSMQSPTVSDMKALKKWSKIPPHVQQLLIGNVFCSKCGVTTIVDYGIHDDRFGVVLNGFCKKCGGRVARMVEDC